MDSKKSYLNVLFLYYNIYNRFKRYKLTVVGPLFIPVVIQYIRVMVTVSWNYLDKQERILCQL